MCHLQHLTGAARAANGAGLHAEGPGLLHLLAGPSVNAMTNKEDAEQSGWLFECNPRRS